MFRSQRMDDRAQKGVSLCDTSQLPHRNQHEGKTERLMAES